ncbi:hypothetical protein [Halococcus saccharolyticus]|uniref:Uncharacterized protein n=1 Tax=Halococcus saccharolyticus DSM 5350 TaxID=1227455 RepID=M0MDG0_9EURY|nr:hypothetical protein [Halococcus saccharolyticus]EMA42699.1 hypothetical protein C449_16193 [Halococcus saccharolyticus DSM 5350]
MNRVRAWLLAVVGGIAVGAGTFAWLVSDPSLAIALGVVYVVGTRLAIEFAATLPGGTGRLDWQQTRWQVAFIAVMVHVATFSANTVLFDSFGTNVALNLLVFNVGSTGLFFGIAIAREQAAAGGLFDETKPAGESEHGDLADMNTEGA